MNIKAFAKLNLTLDICGKREDGYHLLDSIMLSVDPYDIVTIEKSKGIKVDCSDFALGGEENIAFKAAKSFFEYTNISSGADIYIEKHIPKAAGLGGGSADAAAVIRGLDRLFETRLSTRQLYEIALKVGADVPFCIYGGIARVGGIGEIVEPITTRLGFDMVIAKNGVKGSTKQTYEHLDNLGVKRLNTTREAVKALEQNDFTQFSNNIGNAFADVVGLYGLDAAFGETGPVAVSLSGSGPSVFALYDDAASAKKAYTYIKGKNIDCWLASSKEKGIVFE